MEIGINKGYKTVQFKDVEIGNCFVKNHIIYIKANVFSDNTNKERGINLSNGMTDVFLPNDEVELVHCYLVVD